MSALESFVPNGADRYAKLVEFGGDPAGVKDAAKRRLIELFKESGHELVCTVGLWSGNSKPRTVSFAVLRDSDLTDVSLPVAQVTGLRVDQRVHALRLPAHPDLLVQISDILDTVTKYLYGAARPLKIRMWPEYKQKFFTQ